MFGKNLRWIAFLIALVGFASASAAQAAAPQLFFTDLLSAPATGGENGNGAYVTLYGNGFGSSQGTSTVSLNGSTSNVRVVSWGTGWLWYQKIVVQLLPSATTGSLSVNVGGTGSNSLPFTVRGGHIYYVATSGSDSAAGSFTAPWKSVANAVHSMAAGDITYVGNGVTQTAMDNYNGCVAVTSGSGTAAAPVALVGYPGAIATIGSASNCSYSLRTPQVSGSMDYWVVANLKFVSGDFDLVSVLGWRVVGNDLSNTRGSGQSATLHAETVTQLTVNGNYVHDVGTAAGSIDKYYHGVYYTTNSNSIFMGWNEVAPNNIKSTTSGGCRAVQFYSTGGADQFDLHVHDNRIHDSICDGLNFATVNPGKGTVEAYNNVIYHVGTGPDPGNGSSNYACILVGSGGTPTAAADLYNNTLYDCGSRGVSEGDAGALAVFGVPVRLRNNAIQILSGEGYLTNSTSSYCSSFTGSSNLWFGGSGTACSGQLSGNVGSDPLFVAAGSANFHLQSVSPAIDKGTTISALTTDIDGNGRPQGTAYDIGAYEYGTATIAQPAALKPPTNVRVVP